MPDIEFVKSPRTEKDRLQHTKVDIVSGWFLRHNFVIVPAKRSDVSENIQVIYPALLEFAPVDLSMWEREWSLVGEEFWDELDRYLPGSSRQWEKILVKVTRYGTVSSSALDSKYDKSVGTFFLREDTDISHLAAMIVNILLYINRKYLGISWTKREAIMDFVMTRPVMRKLFPGYTPVFTYLSRVPKRIRQESEEYVRSLGIEISEKSIRISGGKVLAAGKLINGVLGKKEEQLVKLLVAKEGEIVSYDEIADMLWGEGEFRTFWAINKIVGRIRAKLAKLGAESSISPVKGRGYIFTS